MPVELRQVGADDWQLWRSIRLAALAEAPHAFGSTLSDWREAPEARWRARLSIPAALDLLAFAADHEQPVGMATGVPDPDTGDQAELISMWVDPAVRGRGVASRLIEAVAAWAAGDGRRRLMLSVMPDNARARAIYARSGFFVAAEPGDLRPDGSRELIMVRDLEPLVPSGD